MEGVDVRGPFPVEDVGEVGLGELEVAEDEEGLDNIFDGVLQGSRFYFERFE